jgi:Protein of unknown function (DUF4100)
MCGETGHLLKDCPETKAFVMQKVLRWSSKGQLIQADGSDLPRGDINNSGVTRVLWDQIANASNVEMDHLCSFDLLNQEFAMFGKHEYEVFPADHEQRHGQKQPHLDDKEELWPRRTECPNCVHIELPEHSVSKHELKGIVNRPPTILKRETCTPEPSTAMPNEDVQMHDGTTDQPWVHRPAITEKELVSPKDKAQATLDNVVIHDEKDQTKHWVSPAYHFAGELQENVQVEGLFKSLMSQEIPIRLGDLIGSSFELGRRLQIAMKMQRVPINPEAMHTKNVEVTISSAEYGINTWMWPLRCPLVNWTLKGDRGVNLVPVDSDDKSSEDKNTLDDIGSELQLTADDHAEEFCWHQTNYSVHTSFLAMVTPRIQGTILGHSMLIDNSNWLLHGTLGHQVDPIGLIWDVPVQGGGISLSHNSFITSDNNGQKNVILGLTLQLLQDRDCDSGWSIQDTWPIMSASQDVHSIKALKYCVTSTKGSVNSIDLITLRTAPKFFPEGELTLKRLRPHVNVLRILNQALQLFTMGKALQGQKSHRNKSRSTITFNWKHYHLTPRGPMIVYWLSKKSPPHLKSRPPLVKHPELGVMLIFDPGTIKPSNLEKDLVKIWELNLTMLHLPTGNEPHVELAFSEGEFSLKKLRPHIKVTGFLIRALETLETWEALYWVHYFHDIVWEGKFGLQFTQVSTRIVLCNKKYKSFIRGILSIATLKLACSPLNTNPLRLGLPLVCLPVPQDLGMDPIHPKNLMP